MSKNNYSTNTIKYITNVKKYLKEKYGKVNNEWETILEILADNLELYQQCREGIKKDGLLLVAKNGAMTRNPLIKTQLDAQIQINKLLDSFGLTPKAAAKINLTNEDDEELKELLGE